MSLIPMNSPAGDLTPAVSVIECLVDGLNEGFVSGWLWDRTRPDQELWVEITGPTFYVRATANDFREDLFQARKRDGWCWFKAQMPAGCSNLSSDTFTVLLGGTTHRLLEAGGGLQQDWLKEQAAEVQHRIFIQRAYFDIVGRAPTFDEWMELLPLVTGGLHYLNALIRAITLLRTAELAALTLPSASVTTAESMVQNAFLGVLGRDAEQSAIEFHGAALRAGMPLAELLDGLVRSGEFLNQNKHDRPAGGEDITVMGRLSASMERALLTLAFGSAASHRIAREPAGSAVFVDQPAHEPATRAHAPVQSKSPPLIKSARKIPKPVHASGRSVG